MRVLAVLAVLLLAACARDTVTLLPGSAGTTGAVAVLDDDGGAVAVIDEPYQVGRVGGTQVSTETTSADEVAAAYGTLLETLPPEPAVFVLYFREGSTQLTSGSLPNLERLLQEVDARPGAEVQVTGHTDTVGKVEDNDTSVQGPRGGGPANLDCAGSAARSGDRRRPRRARTGRANR